MYNLNNPPTHIKMLPSKAMRVWIEAFNSAWKEHPNDEGTCNKIAWGAVTQAGYAKNSEGKWVKESDGVYEVGDLTEAEFDSTARVIKNAILIRAGESANRRYYSADVLRRDGPGVFEGVRGYLGHTETYHQRTDPRNLAGTIQGVRFQESDKTLRGDVHYFKDSDPVIEKAKEAHDAGLKDLIGLSIQASGKQKITQRGGRAVMEVEALVGGPGTSVDIVVGPAAGGRLFEAIFAEEDTVDLTKLTLEELREARPDLYKAITESAEKKEMTLEKFQEAYPELYKTIIESVQKNENHQVGMTAEQITEAANRIADEKIKAYECAISLENTLREANLPKEMEDKVRAQFKDKVFESKEIEDEVKFFKDLAAKQFRPVREGSRIQMGLEPTDKLQIALDAAFGVCENSQGVRPFSGLREAYIAYTGDVDVTGYFRLSESGLTSNSLPYALANSMTKRLIKDYKQRDWGWRKFCAVNQVTDFKTQDRVRIGYLNDLDDVDPEAEDYQEAAIYGDEKVTFSLTQKGNVIPVTRKHIINDDLSTVIKLTGRMGRAAARTLAKRVYITRLAGNSAYNVLPSDGSTTFFSATRTVTANRNTGLTTALSKDAAIAVMQVLEGTVEPSSGEALGIQCLPGNTVLIVPNALKMTAYGINQLNGVETYNPLYHFFGENNENIVVCPLLDASDKTDWYLGLTAEELEWIEVNFLQGREEPELFLADNPVVGDMFIADKMKYKIRHEYEVVFLDPRGCYKSVVA